MHAGQIILTALIIIFRLLYLTIKLFIKLIKSISGFAIMKYKVNKLQF